MVYIVIAALVVTFDKVKVLDEPRYDLCQGRTYNISNDGKCCIQLFEKCFKATVIVVI